MLSEEHFFKAKSFLGLYKESLQTLSDIAAKKSHIEYTEEFYSKLQDAKLRKQLSFDQSGNLSKDQNFSTSYFPRLFDLSQTHVLSQIGSPKDYIDFYNTLNSVHDKIELQVRLLQASKAVSS